LVYLGQGRANCPGNPGWPEPHDRQGLHGMSEQKGAKAPSSRKAAQRERDRSLGIKRVEIRLSADTLAAVEKACAIRGGVSGPYELTEYVETLIEQDAERLALHLEQLAQAPCQKCGKTIPEGGCGGVHKWEIDCLLTREEKQLLLREPRTFTISELSLNHAGYE
ncbi:MAG: hypothetical protein ACRDC7_09215, partial [Aeromonas veronii]